MPPYSRRPILRRPFVSACLLTALALAAAALTSRGFAQINGSSFAPKFDYAATLNPWQVAAADVDGDGKPDLIVSNASGADVVSVYRNTSTPGTIDANSFAAPVDFPVGSNPAGVAVGDFDGDGKLDLVVANASSSTISVLKNTSTPGSVSFAPRADYATGSSPYIVVVGDIDGDSRPDFAVHDYDSNTVSVYRNTSTVGSVAFAARVVLNAGANPYGLAIGDLDGDGKLDLAAPNRSDNTVSVFRNTSGIGVVTFAPRADFATGTSPAGAAAADVDGDGKFDLTVVSETGNLISVLRNTGAPGSVAFAPKADFAAGTSPFAVAVGDLDADGKPDVVVTNRFGDTVSVFGNASTPGAVSFTTRADFATGTEPLTVAIRDLDGDGRPDLAVTNWVGGTVSVYRNTVSAVTDSDGDGVPDASDNCPATFNPGQSDFDFDGAGDACDPDDDNDGVADAEDLCPNTPPDAEVDAGGCGLTIPTVKEQCKNGGWKTVVRADGSHFKNQGDCARYFNAHN